MFAVPSQLPLDTRQILALLPNGPSTPSKNLTTPLTPSLNYSIQAIKAELGQRITRMQTVLQQGKAPTLFESDETESSLNCTFAFYGQLDSTSLPSDQMRIYEAETHDPTGRALPSLPPMRLSGILHSSDCDLLIKLQVQGVTKSYFWHSKTTRFAFVLGVVTLVQVVLIVRQMEKCSTPSRLVRVSYWTVVAQGALDSYSFVSNLLLVLVKCLRRTGRSSYSGHFGR